MSDSTVSTLVRLNCAYAGGRTDVAVRLWGRSDPEARIAVCVHGLSRNARDFDELAGALAPRWRVACIDMPGRGDSAWLADPAHYSGDTYAQLALQVIAHLGAGPVHWIGTSMGGLLGLRLAAQQPQRIAALVLNDVGAELHGHELGEQRRMAAEAVTFADGDEALAYFRKRYAAFGIRSEARWRHLAATSTEPDQAGRLRPRFDVRAVPSAPDTPRLDLWATYAAVRCPVLVLRGAQSRLLSAATCERMAQGGPHAAAIEIPGCGHAPDLTGADRIAPIVHFLESVP